MNRVTDMAFPKSRKSAPGLQILIASSRLSRVVRMSLFDSSSISPTGYVSFRSPWKPINKQGFKKDQNTLT